MVLATLLGIVIVQRLTRIIAFLVVAAFFAVVLTPPVDFLERRVRIRRAGATLLVFFLGVVLFSAMLFAFIRPIVREVNQFVEELPSLVQDAQEGRGTVGRLVQRYNIDEFVAENQERFQEGLRNAGAPALQVVRTVANTVFALLTILVLAFLMVLQGPRMTQVALGVMSPVWRERIRLIAGDCAKAVSGYMAGNLLISVIAGLATFVFLSVINVPFAGVLGLWVAFADLIPMVGATLGAIPTVGVAFLASPTKGFVTLAFYIVYQQFENHYLQVTIMSRTVDLNPLAVLVSVLVGVELFGILGALLAIPAAGVLQVIGRDLYDERRGRLKEVPTVGADEVPMGRAVGDGEPAAPRSDAGESPPEPPGAGTPEPREAEAPVADTGVAGPAEPPRAERPGPAAPPALPARSVPPAEPVPAAAPGVPVRPRDDFGDEDRP